VPEIREEKAIQNTVALAAGSLFLHIRNSEDIRTYKGRGCPWNFDILKKGRRGRDAAYPGNSRCQP
jgi:hypothetical protein